MCGIVGFIGKKDIKTLESMLEIQSYRGPDDRGIYFDEISGLHLGHNRLSIQDLSPLGHQPMISEDGSHIIVFNGEVYNFFRLKKELEEKGYSFNSHSDTEVILKSFIEWGVEKAVSKFIGMFAIAYFDKTKKRLFLIRDRAGVKPLYFYQKNNVFMFSSEIKSFHRHPAFTKEINYDVLSYFFQFGYIPEPYSVFKNCYKLQAGHYLEFNIQNSTFEIHKYWDVADFYRKEKFKKNEKEILYEIEDILSDSVNLRMIADVPVGVFLSGGVDSSFVSALLAKKLNKKIDTFTIGFEDKKYDEAKYAAEIAKYLNTNHHEYYVNAKEMLGLVEKLPFFYDEPFGDSSALPTMLVSKKAKEKVTVALSADGGDEAFVGYSKYFFLMKFASVFSNSFKKPLLKSFLNITNENLIEKLNSLLPESKRQRNIKDKYLKFKRAVNSKDFQEMFLNASSYVSPEIVKGILNSYDNKMFKNFYECKDLDLLNYML
ncbi:asparagine synthase (glutamine-hydrolyzing), partial [Caminibacter sp.]